MAESLLCLAMCVALLPIARTFPYGEGNGGATTSWAGPDWSRTTAESHYPLLSFPVNPTPAAPARPYIGDGYTTSGPERAYGLYGDGYSRSNGFSSSGQITSPRMPAWGYAGSDQGAYGRGDDYLSRKQDADLSFLSKLDTRGLVLHEEMDGRDEYGNGHSTSTRTVRRGVPMQRDTVQDAFALLPPPGQSYVVGSSNIYLQDESRGW